MKTRRLTQKLNERLQAGKRVYTVYDTKLKGYGITVYPSGRKSWFIRLTHGRHRKWHRLGDAGRVDEAVARQQAQHLITTICSPPACAVAQPVLRDALFEDVAAEFLHRYQRNWKPITYQSNCESMDRYILPWFTGTQIGSITAGDVRAWFASMSDTPGVANRSLPVLSVMMQQAELYGYRGEASTPCKGIPRYRLARRERFLTAEELRRLGTVLTVFSLRWPTTCALIRLLALTGARKGEVLGLLWADYRDGQIYLADSKTGERCVFLSAPSRHLLDSLPRCAEWVFAKSADAPLSEQMLFYRWAHIRVAAGLDDLRIHDLRHSFASTALAYGEHLLVIGRLLGHRDADTTLKYAHLCEEQVARTARAVSTSLARGTGL